MTTATRNEPYTVQLVNHDTRKNYTYHLHAGQNLTELLRDVIDFDLSQAFSDGMTRSLVITANPQEKH